MSLRRNDDAPPRTAGHSLAAVLAAGAARKATGVDDLILTPEELRQRKVDRELAEVVKRRKTEGREMEPEVLLGLNRDAWLVIMKNVDNADACQTIGRMCQAGNKQGQPPWKIMCDDESTWDELNKSLGFYGSFGTRDAARQWYVDQKGVDHDYTKTLSAVSSDIDHLRNLTPREHFKDICMDRKAVYAQKKHIDEVYEGGGRPTTEDLLTYRTMIKVLCNPPSAPHALAQAKWIVGIDDRALEFIPGSVIQLDRVTNADLIIGLDNPAVRELHEQITLNSHPDVFEDYAEIALIAVRENADNLRFVPGAINDINGMQKFAPCRGFAKIVKAAVIEDGSVLSKVPGSQVNPADWTANPTPPSPIAAMENYKELAILAAKTNYWALKWVPGSIDPESGRQLRKPIEGYKEIAEAFMRRSGRALKYVPGSVIYPDRTTSSVEPIEGYKEIAKVAIDNYHTVGNYFVPEALMQTKEMAEYQAAASERWNAELDAKKRAGEARKELTKAQGAIAAMSVQDQGSGV